jgi:hypothetical protein
VRLADLAARLPRRQASDDQVLAELVQAARLPREVRQQLGEWAPVVDAVAAGAQGDQQAIADLEPFLAEQAKNPDWALLVAVLGRILAGERGENLTQGLDAVDAAIAAQTLRRLSAE